MTAGLRRAGLLLFAVVALGVIVWNLVPASGTSPPDIDGSPSPYASVSPATIDDPSSTRLQSDVREYALPLEELRGFPSDAVPGMRIELWVIWNRQTNAPPKLQRVLSAAEFVRLVPPFTPGGPTAVVLRVPVRQIPDLLWADAYGALSAAVLP